jgi:hypothetical protein
MFFSSVFTLDFSLFSACSNCFSNVGLVAGLGFPSGVGDPPLPLSPSSSPSSSSESGSSTVGTALYTFLNTSVLNVLYEETASGVSPIAIGGYSLWCVSQSHSVPGTEIVPNFARVNNVFICSPNSFNRSFSEFIIPTSFVAEFPSVSVTVILVLSGTKESSKD